MNNIFYWISLIFMTMAISAKSQEHQITMDWSIAFSLPADEAGVVHTGLAGPIVGVFNEMLFIGGGSNFPEKLPWEGGAKAYYKTMYIYSKVGDQEELLHVAELPFDLAYGASYSTAQGVVVAGGENQDGLSDRVLLLRYNRKKNCLEVEQLPSLPSVLTNAAIAGIEDKLYIAGGEGSEEVSNELLMLDMRHLEKGWTKQAKLPYPVSHTCLASIGESLYLLGGRKSNKGGISDFYKEVWEYLPTLKQWIAKRPLPEALSAGTSLSMDENTIWLFSGDKGTTFKQVEKLIQKIADEKDPVKKSALIEAKNTLQARHPGFGRKVWMYNHSTDTWESKQDLPIDAPVTTTAVWWKGQVYLPSGEVRAGVRSPVVLKGKIK